MRLALTLGDPAGIGPEIVLALFEQGGLPKGVELTIVGEARHLEQAAERRGIRARVTPAPLTAKPREPGAPLALPVAEPPDFHFEGPLELGRVDAQCGAAAWAYVRHAVELARAGTVDAIVTAPLHKEALRAAGCRHAGHTELLAELAGGARVAMLLAGGGLRVALATIHVPLARVPGLLRTEGILEHLRLLDRFIPYFGLDTGRRPRLAVAALNPHAGEGGMFGREEAEIITPAIDRAQAEGIDAAGPMPGDTVFHLHREGACDAVLAMYHDQGLIPVKTLDFHGGVNVTMGLPFIRTSVDHGTAFDLAGTGHARPDSLRAAVEIATLLARNRRRLDAGGSM